MCRAASAGGAAYQTNSGGTIGDTLFQRNSGRLGGAVYSNAGRESFLNCTFLANGAGLGGGAVYLVSGTTSMKLQVQHQ
jgi:predicted outer membrane repeat protein